MVDDKFDKMAYNRYKGKITCAYKEDVRVNKQGISFVVAKRTKEREKYLFKGFGNGKDPILLDCPPDVLAIEFEEGREINTIMIGIVEYKLKKLGLEYCVVDHGGTSPYIYVWNLKGLPQGQESEAKKYIATKLIPQPDWSNFGSTLIPVIDAPHWKHKYNGAYHKIVRGKNPIFHCNDVTELLKGFKPKEDKPKKTSDLDETCQKIKMSVKLSDVLRTYGVDVSSSRTGCLWHDSKSKTCFSFDDAKGLWHCFHCEKSGNIFQLIIEQEGCDFPTAKRKAAEIGGVELVA